MVIARDLTLDAARDARAARRPGSLLSQGPSGPQIKKLLESRNDRDVLEGLRKVIGVSKTLIVPKSQDISYSLDNLTERF